MEDIVTVLDGVSGFEIDNLDNDISCYLDEMASKCLTSASIQEAINAFLADPNKVRQVNEKLRSMIEKVTTK